MGPDGRIVVPLLQDQQVYDAAGSLKAAFGRRGGGPGEFQGIGTMGFAGDTLWIYDARLRRVTRVASDGTVLRAEPTPADIPVHDPGAGGAVGSIVIFTPVAVHGDDAMLGDARYRTTRERGGTP